MSTLSRLFVNVGPGLIRLRDDVDPGRQTAQLELRLTPDSLVTRQTRGGVSPATTPQLSQLEPGAGQRKRKSRQGCQSQNTSLCQKCQKETGIGLHKLMF